MLRLTRDKFAATTQRNITGGNACLETPPAVFTKLQTDFGPFDVDLTGDATRALLPVWFGPGGVYPNALTAPWGAHGTRGYSNPPYGPFVAKILRKAKDEAFRGFGSTLLLPVRITRAFHAHVLYGATDLLFCDKRIAFWENGLVKLDPKTGKPTGALFDSMIVRYIPGKRLSPPRVGTWHVPKHG